MTQTNNSYDKLYENMRQRFTVSVEENQYTIGEYMLMKADGIYDEENLPVEVKTAAVKSEMTVTNIVSFVDEKLTIKQPPIKDKTIRKFPFRASASAFLTASVACAFILSFALIGAKSFAAPTTSAKDISVNDQMIEEKDAERMDFYINN